MSKLTDSIAKEIFPPGKRVFAIFDGASVPELMDALERWQPKLECLYPGKLEPDMAEVAPYLVELVPGSPVAEWSLTGWGQHWGVFVHSELSALKLSQHFYRFIEVISPENKRLLFRYYDPRVLRSYLPTCTGEDLTRFFGPVQALLAEGEKPGQLLHFTLEGGRLKTDIKQFKEE